MNTHAAVVLMVWLLFLVVAVAASLRAGLSPSSLSRGASDRVRHPPRTANGPDRAAPPRRPTRVNNTIIIKKKNLLSKHMRLSSNDLASVYADDE